MSTADLGDAALCVRAVAPGVFKFELVDPLSRYPAGFLEAFFAALAEQAFEVVTSAPTYH
jgi:hypothetical protein